MIQKVEFDPAKPVPSFREHALAQLACFVLVSLTFRFWSVNLRVPFVYGGDAFFTQMLVKSEIDAGSSFTNPFLGAPFRLEMFDHPVGGRLHFFALKLLSLVTSDGALAINLYFLLGFFLITASALAVFRRFGLGPRGAFVAALLFAFLPYHLIRGEGHLFLSTYYAVPPALLLVYWVATGRVSIDWPLDRRALAALAIAALVSSTSVYYACFTGVLLLAHGVLAARRSARADSPRVWGFDLRVLRTVSVLLVALTLAFAANIAPNLFHIADHGRNREVANRSQVESELFGLRIAALLLPAPEHRLEPLRRLRAGYDRGVAQIESSSSALGVFGGFGFVLLLVELVRRSRDGLREFLAESNLILVLLGTTGAFGSLAALFVTPLIRAYTRVSVFIGFLSLACAALLLERLFEWLEPRVRVPFAREALLLVVLTLGVLDQATPDRIPDSAALTRQFTADRSFVRKLESTLPADAALFVLPYLAFPEATSRITANDLFRGYLHSRQLRWSAGAMNATYAALWQEAVSAEPPQKLVETLTLAGFDAIYVDRRGLVDRALLEGPLTELLGAPLVDDTGELAVFALARVRSRLVDTPAWAGRAHVTRRVLTGWQGFFAKEQQGARGWHWSSGESEIRLLNPGDAPRTVKLTFRCYGAALEPTRLHIGGLVDEELELSPIRQVFERTLEVPAGGGALSFIARGKPVIPPGDGRPLAFAVEDFVLEELD